MAEKKSNLPDQTAFPPNSKKVKEPEEKKVEKVIQGNVVTRKKPLGKKFSENFLGDDIQNVRGYIIFDVIIPAIKETISNVVSNGVEMLLFGEPKATKANKKNGTYVSYSSYYNKSDRRPSSSSQRGGRHDFRDIILETRGEAEEVLSNLVDLVYDYGSASVADLYDLVGITGNFTDNKYGWNDLAGASVSRARGGGYIIDLPKVVLLD